MDYGDGRRDTKVRMAGGPQEVGKVRKQIIPEGFTGNAALKTT